MAKPDLQRVVGNPSGDAVYSEAGKTTLNVKAFKSGNGTVGGGGTVTITDSCVTANSKIIITNTLGARAIAVTSRTAGSFVVTGTAADTFDYLITNM